jgi:hypothetical protein
VNNRAQSGKPPARWLHRLHRWLGLGSIAFVLLLSVTGIALNHTGDLRLDQRFFQAPSLLDWYGIEAPPPESSFLAGSHRVSLIGSRVYFDRTELADDISELVGAVETPSYVAIATPTELYLVASDGSLVERIETQLYLAANVTGLGTDGATLVLKSEDEWFRTDENFLEFDLCLERDVAGVAWSVATELPKEDLAILQELYRGRGLSLERIVLDLHSGKILTRVGPILMDIVGGVFILLSLLGLAMWLGRSGKPRSTA